MTRTRVYIATTEGPSEIQGIIEEDSDLQSVICLDGTASALPVSSGYDAFVRKPTGVVERFTSNRVYRMDVSAPITNGHSWQVGAYLAHVLQHHGVLATKDEAANQTVLATGALRTRDLHVDSVGHIIEKLEAADSLIEQGSCMFLLPDSDFAVLSQETLDRYSDKVDFKPLSHAENLLSLLNEQPDRPIEAQFQAEDTPKLPEAIPQQISPKGNRNWLMGLAVLGVIVFGLGGYLFNQWQTGLYLQKEMARMTRNGHYIDLLDLTNNEVYLSTAGKIANYFFPIKQAGDNLDVKFSKLTPGDGKACAGIRFRETQLVNSPFKTSDSQNYLYASDKGLQVCGFELQINNEDDRDLEIISLIKPNMIMGRFVADKDPGNVETFFLPSKGARSIEVKLPLYRNGQLAYNIWVVGSPRPSRQLLDMLKAEDRSDNSLTFVWQDLKRVGVNLVEAEILFNE